MEGVLLFGGGGHAKVVIDALRGAGEPIGGVIDDDPNAASRRLLGVEVVGDRSVLEQAWEGAAIVPAIGDNQARAESIEWLARLGRRLQSVVHPRATIGAGVELGGGSFFAAGAIANPDTRIGKGVIVNTGASVDHDCRLDLCVHVAPGAVLCGGVQVGARTLIGAGAVVIPGIRIGADVVIGAGTVVIRDVPDGARVCGSPGKFIESR